MRFWWKRRAPKIPVFYIARDRVGVLRKSLDSLAPFREQLQIVLHDNESSFPGMLEYLSELESQGARVYSSKHTGSLEDISESVAQTIQRWFDDSKSRAQHYVVSDPDIAFEDPPPDLLDIYRAILDRYSEAMVVGPMLRIDDIPDAYPLKEKVIQLHTEQFWHKEPVTVRILNKSIQIQQAPIDTTFGMYRRDFGFKRLNMGVRVYAPYAARHLDWYIDPANMQPDQVYYVNHASEVSHWGGAWLKEQLESGHTSS